ncbi:hypothetical protein AB6802_17795 [Mesorhizobium sp. RCC_202]|uniref:hypothetical protein n=1 Tax=Mesorhizobium sp. RCC_202 TaxID=3239222 RepID=UPI00352657A6
MPELSTLGLFTIACLALAGHALIASRNAGQGVRRGFATYLKKQGQPQGINSF